jgi:perosamine synthetase
MNPVYGIEEKQAVIDYINSDGWLMEFKKTRELEKLIIDFTNSTYCSMTTSCTVALFLVCLAIELKAGDEVLMPAYTQAATANGAKMCGATIVFCDVDPVSYTIKYEEIQKNFTNKTRAIFITSINGRYPSNINEIIKWCKDRNLWVIEDSAQALGCYKHNKHIGTLGDFGCFSFGAPKMITTGQGGAIISHNKKMMDKIDAIKNFGRTVGIGEVYNIFGLNFKFTDLQAAFGVEQMKKLPDILIKKKQIYNWYQKHLKHSNIKFPKTEEGAVPVFADVLFENKKWRDIIAKKLSEVDIGCRAVYAPLNKSPLYKNINNAHTPIADDIGKRGLQLPAQPNLDEKDIIQITNHILSWVT